MVDFTNATVIAAAIAAVASLIVAMFSFLSTQHNQRKLESLKAVLTEIQAEKDARRDYQYEARKRLYQQYEPLFFQLVEFSDNALWRIYSLARTAREGNLGPDRVNWLSPKSFYYNYYIASTIYKLLSPLVFLKLIQRRLTLVDLAVDPHINDQYALAKWLYISFTESFKLASIAPRLEYDPDCDEWPEKRKQHPQKHWRQAVFAGRLDIAVEALIVRDNSEGWHCMSYGEFESAYRDEKAREKFSAFADLFLDFHPMMRPILWRVLIVQAHLYEALLRALELQPSTSNDHPTSKLLKPIAKENLWRYDWRQSPKEASDEEVLIEPFKAAQAYLQEFLGSICAF